MVKGEMKERNGRDKNNLHRAGMPFYKGIPTMTGEMETKLFEASLPYPMHEHL